MNRNNMLQMLRSRKKPWDIIIIGGGATGLGTAIDAASRGYETLLIEKNDFAKGTSSRSTKLVHGGVRYLQNGDISLVVEALRERGLMKNNAPHLVQNLSFVIPSYEWWSSPFYGIGLKIYDMMAGKLGLGSTTFLNKEEVLQFIPTIKQEELNGGVIYYDGQFDDARMATSMAQTAVDHNAVVINYIEVKNLLKRKGMVAGVKLKDQFSDDEYEVFGRVVINATGVFSDSIMKMDDSEAPDTIAPSQGIHLVLDRKFLNSDHAIMVPQTSDGRVMFAVPWHNKVVIGTTDTLVSEILEEPRPREEEIDFLLKTAADYMTVPPKRSDIKSIFAGLRPLAAASNEKKETKEVSRGHKIVVSDSGLVSIVGGK
ncbi:MAG: glycerol-3-phosphate dehydrogenase/oxidase, partial [Cyclobacteriaceae bacterium]|nr:glycerol-3-phosphate dehydrogenase/oxidase [Cyclobacteriaceae bacterium]